MEDALNQRFEAACQQVKRAGDLDPETSLLFYGLFKQAMSGPPSEGPPGGFVAAQKYNAWKKNAGKTREQAKEEYVQLAEELGSEGQQTSFGNTVSRFTMDSTSLAPASPPSVSSTEIDSVCIQIRSGKLDTALLTKLTPNVQDSEGLTPLHHAADSGQAEIVRELVNAYNADVNKQDLAGMTPLHYAVVLESTEVVSELVKCPRVDVSIADNDGQTAWDMANEEIQGMLKTRLQGE